MSTRQWLMRADGELVRIFRVGCSLTERQIEDLIRHHEKLTGMKAPIGDILSERLWAGINAWAADDKWEGA